MQEKKKSHPDFPPKPNFVSLHLPLPTTRALIGYPQQRLACILYGLHSDCEKKKKFLKTNKNISSENYLLCISLIYLE